MVKIERLPSGSYRARVHLGGGKYKSITGKDKKAVQLEAAQYEAGIADKKESLHDTALDMSLGEAMERYINIKSEILSPSTIRGYDSMRRTRVPRLVAMRIGDITQEDIQIAINEDAAGHDAKSVRNLHGFVSTVLGVYRADLHLSTSLPQRKKPHIEIPTQAEVDRMFEYFAGTDMEIPFALAACCGLRVSEICGMKWNSVDFEHNRMIVTEVIVPDKEGDLVQKSITKTMSSDRSVRLYPFIRDRLEAADKSSVHVTELSPTTITKRFSRALEKCGLPHYRFHDLRHYLVSVMLALNIPKMYIADYVGHASQNMIDTVYGHIMATRKSDIEDIMDAYFSKSATQSVTDNK